MADSQVKALLPEVHGHILLWNLWKNIIRP